MAFNALPWVEDEIARVYACLDSPDAPVQWYLALFNGNGTISGNNMTNEFSGGSYARQPLDWVDLGGGVVENDGPINFTVPADTLRGFKVVDTVSGAPGRYLVGAALPNQVLSAGAFSIAAGDITIEVL